MESTVDVAICEKRPAPIFLSILKPSSFDELSVQFKLISDPERPEERFDGAAGLNGVVAFAVAV